MEILLNYHKSLGQMVNLDKSEVSFNRNVRNEVKEIIHNRMGVKTIIAYSRYLGLPVVI